MKSKSLSQKLRPLGLLLLLTSLVLTSCTPVAAATEAAPAGPPEAVLTIVAATFQALTPSPAPSATLEPTAQPTNPAEPVKASPTAISLPTQDNRPTAKYWPEYPVVPTASARVKEIYALGQTLGNNPRSFTVVGDCQSDPDVFMGTFDTDRYRLSDSNLGLQETIDNFKGYFGHKSLSVKDGLSVSSALSPLWADQSVCQPNETPIACEYRLARPSFVIINLGTNWKNAGAEDYEKYLRQVVEYWIQNGVVPILSTKVDNLEGDHSLNLATSQVAYDYSLPLVNFWKVADKLPNHGLDPHHDPTQPLTYLTTDAWYMRSVAGLQALDSIWRDVTGRPSSVPTATQAAPADATQAVVTPDAAAPVATDSP